MADACISLARIRCERCAFEEAEDLLAKAMEISERIGRLKSLARGLGLLGDVRQKKGEDVQAKRSCCVPSRSHGDLKTRFAWLTPIQRSEVFLKTARIGRRRFFCGEMRARSSRRLACLSEFGT